MIKKNIVILILLINTLISLDDGIESLSLSFYNFQQDSSDFSNSQSYHKSDNILKPMMMSMFLPGLGQYIQGNKKRAWFFLSVELLSIYANKYYNERGDENVSEYKHFADEHWSFENWINSYGCWNPGEDCQNCGGPNVRTNQNPDYAYLFSSPEIATNGELYYQWQNIWDSSHHINFYYNGSSGTVSTLDSEFTDLYYDEFIDWDYGEPFEDLNDNGQWDDGEYWVECNNNRSICDGESGWDASMADGIYNSGPHNGASFVDVYNIQFINDHDFYEGIRKYNVFFAGWDDSAQGISATVQNNSNIATSPNKDQYNTTWNHSIELYDYAEYAITAIYLNHLISVFDVYLKSKFDNKFNIDVQNEYNSSTKTPNYLFELSIRL